MRSIYLLVASLASVSLAAPARGIFNDVYEYSRELAEYYARVSQHISVSPSATCDPSRIALPAFASGLPGPSGQKPAYVAVGHGTQNYTCATSTSDSAPVAIGAVASLYNATCTAANYPDLMAMLPNLAYNIPLSNDLTVSLPPANIALFGHHFFRDTTTPIFNLDTAPSKQYGIAVVKKGSSIDAPSDSVKGQHGAVTWLYLPTINGTVGKYSSVYRVNTAGGQPPSTCEGMEPVFTVQYAANYYFYES